MRRAELKSLSVLMTTAFVDMIGFAIVLPQAPFYAVRLGAEEWLVGPLMATFAVAQLISAPRWGALSDRVGRRPAILLGLLFSAIAFTLFGLANQLWLLFASRLAQGIGGGTTGVLQAYVADSTMPSHRARALGWLSAATSAGVMIGPALGSLAVTWGYAAPGLLAAALCLVNLLFATRWLPESHRDVTAPPDEGLAERKPHSIRGAVWAVIARPTESTARLILIYGVGMGAFTALTTVLPLFLHLRFAVTEVTIGYFFLYVGALSVVMRALIIGWLVDRLGERKVALLGGATMGAGFALMPFAGSVPVFLLAASSLPVGTALLFPATSAMVTHRTPRKNMGRVLGVQQAFGGMARIVGPIWGAAAYQAFGANVPFLVSAVVMTGVVVFALGIESYREAVDGAGAPAG